MLVLLAAPARGAGGGRLPCRSAQLQIHCPYRIAVNAPPPTAIASSVLSPSSQCGCAQTRCWRPSARAQSQTVPARPHVPIGRLQSSVGNRVLPVRLPPSSVLLSLARGWYIVAPAEE